MGDWEEAELLNDEPIEPSGKVERWRRTSVAGGILTGIGLGIEQAIFGRKPREESAVVIEAGEPPGDREFDVDLDPDDPGASTVTIHR